MGPLVGFFRRFNCFHVRRGEVEEDACDLVLLPSNMSFKGERVVCLLLKAMVGLRRAPLLWFHQLQRTVYALGGEDTFESTLSRNSTLQNSWRSVK